LVDLHIQEPHPTMSILPQFVEKFRYSRLGPASDEEQGGYQVKFNLVQIITSKAVRAVVILAILLFIVVGLFNLPSPSLGPFHQDASESPSATPSSSGKDSSSAPGAYGSVDWSRFAYVQYVTNSAYLCNSVMLFEILHRLGAKANKLMMYPSNIDVDGTGSDSALVRKARDQYGVKLQPIKVQSRSGGDSTWAESYTKLLAFNQTQYDRVLSLDSDSTILQTMDELFLIPSCPVAMPRAYWLDFEKRILSSQLVLIEPSEFEFNRVMKAINEAKSNDYDMEIVNNLYRDSALILPHRPYDLLTGEFKSSKHADYLGNSEEEWDPEQALKEAKFLHFSDWPVPKPWISASPSVITSNQPKCFPNPKTDQEDCRSRDFWLGFYSDFRERRQKVCGLQASKRDPLDLESREPGPWEPIF